MNSDFLTFHYPPEVFSLLIQTIPLLCRSKKDVLLFFQGAGVDSTLTHDIATIVNTNRDSISKYKITETVLTRLNEKGELALRQRREIIKRIVEFEAFSHCWKEDELKAKGLVAEIRKVVNVKDSFTRMQQEWEEERKKRQAEQEAKEKEIERQRNELRTVKKDLFLLFRESDSHKRGKQLEEVLNRLFKVSGIFLREAFTLTGDQGEGIIEQIDGIAEIDGELYLVEMKWWNKNLGKSEVSNHLIGVYHRGHARGILISASDYTQAAINICKESLQRTVVVLCKLEEIVLLLEQEKDLKTMLKDKINAAIID